MATPMRVRYTVDDGLPLALSLDATRMAMTGAELMSAVERDQHLASPAATYEWQTLDGGRARGRGPSTSLARGHGGLARGVCLTCMTLSDGYHCFSVVTSNGNMMKST